MAPDDVPSDQNLGENLEPAGPDEYTAGFLDGIRAHRVDLVNHVRPVVACYGIRVDADLSVRRVGRVRNLFKLEEYSPDNPSDDPRYAAGFDAGYERGGEVNILALQRSLLGEKILLTDEGLAATMAAVTELVKRFHDRQSSDAERKEFGFEQPRHFDPEADADDIDADDEPEAESLGTGSDDHPRDESLPEVGIPSDDLDRDLQRAADVEEGSKESSPELPTVPVQGVESSEQEPMSSGVRSPPALTAGPRSAGEAAASLAAGFPDQTPVRAPRRRRGAWSMLKEVMHRRRVLAGFVGGTITTALAFVPFLLSDAPAPEVPAPSKIQATQWTPPTHWDLDPPASKARFLAIDHWVFDEQAANGVPAPSVAFIVELVMGLEGANDVKGIVARYLRNTLNPHYLTNLIDGLSPAKTDVRTRRYLLTTIDRVWNLAGRNQPSAVLLSLLQNHQNNAQEPDPQANLVLAKLITKIQNN